MHMHCLCPPLVYDYLFWSMRITLLWDIGHWSEFASCINWSIVKRETRHVPNEMNHMQTSWICALCLLDASTQSLNKALPSVFLPSRNPMKRKPAISKILLVSFQIKELVMNWWSYDWLIILWCRSRKKFWTSLACRQVLVHLSGLSWYRLKVLFLWN